MIAKDALVYAQQGKRKTLQRKDLGKLNLLTKGSVRYIWKKDLLFICASFKIDNAIEAVDEFAFLEGRSMFFFV